MIDNFYNIENIEARFKEITGLDNTINLSIFPITEHISFPIRNDNKKSHGEVFTPIEIVDKMILLSNPNPIKYNLDLCAGRGQFTIRILRKFYNDNNNFDIYNYLTKFHWFNELNKSSAEELIYIFGNKINLAIGPSQELNTYPIDENKIWKYGIINWNINRWIEQDENILINTFFNI